VEINQEVLVKINKIILFATLIIPSLATANFVTNIQIEEELNQFAKILCHSEDAIKNVSSEYKLEAEIKTENQKVYLFDSFINKKRAVVYTKYSLIKFYDISDFNNKVIAEAKILKDCSLGSIFISSDANPIYKNKQFSQESFYQNDAIKIAIVDSGFDLEHDDLAPFVLRDSHKNFIVKDYVLGDSELKRDLHGNHVAGIASQKDNEIAIIPIVRPGYPLEGEPIRLPVTELLQWAQNKNNKLELDSIDFAYKQGARVINMSFGTLSERATGIFSPIYDLLKTDKATALFGYVEAFKKYPQLLFVVASGNNAINIDKEVFIPASFIEENKITVGAVDDKGVIANFSNYGKKVDLFAAGVNINSYSVVANRLGRNEEVNRTPYTLESGTSMAAPLISHYAAKILYSNPELVPAKIKEILCQSVIKTKALKNLSRCGGYFDVEVLQQTLIAKGLNPIES
jgi:subtilisin family serine protease